MISVAFTICSNNYLAHAYVVADSFLRYHPDFIFVIGLVDKIDLHYIRIGDNRIKVVEAAELKISEFDTLVTKYNITELNTAVKPSYFSYIFKALNAEIAIYLDPDILVKGRFDEVLDVLNKGFTKILTPHICTPVDDGKAPSDFDTLRTGIFNLGFIALRKYHEVQVFLDWWHARVVKYGEGDLARGRFYDQIWMNYIPVMFDDYFILKHPGYNMANWNWHERVITASTDNEYVVNNKFPLRFFHFSSYSFKKPDVLCKYQNRFDFNSRPDLVKIFNEYQDLLLKNDVVRINAAEVVYYPTLNKPKQRNLVSLYTSLANRLRKTKRMLLKGY